MLPAVQSFGGYRLDTAQRRLTNLAGAAVKLTGKPFDALAYLVERAGQVVDRTTLVQALWPKRIVEDNNLNQTIAAIRRAIGDEHIVTVAGRGYQFVTPVSELARDQPEGETSNVSSSAQHDVTGPSVESLPIKPPPPRRWRSFAAAAAVVGLVSIAIASFGIRESAPWPSSRLSIAVLPLENLSPDPEKAYIAWHFHEAIIGRLLDFGFDVLPRGAVRQYVPGATPPVAEIGRELDVDAVMEGTVRYADDRLRISLTLVSMGDSKALWHEEFERDYSDLFTIELDVARNVADALQATLTPHQLAAAAEGYAPDPVAYDLYLTGVDHERRSIYNRDFVISQYTQATQIDPNFSLAWARLAFAKIVKRRWLSADPELLPSAREAAERALDITPDLALAKVALVLIRFLEGADRRELLHDLNAIEGKSQRIPEFYSVRASVYSDLGLLEEQLADRDQVVILEPRNVPQLLANGEASMLLRRYDEAQALFDRARALEPNDIGMLMHSAGLPLLRDGDPRAALELLPRILSREMPPARGFAWAATYDGDFDAAVRVLSQWRDAPGAYQRPVLLGQALALAGRQDEAHEQFVTALERIEAQLATASPGERPALEIALGAAKLGLDEQAAAIEHVNAGLRELHLVPPLDGLNLRVDAILVLASAGDVESTLIELDRYLSGPGNWSLEGLLRHPSFDRMRDDARFVELLTKHRASGARLVATQSVSR